MKVDLQEVHRILCNLSSMPGFHTTTNRATAAAVVGHETVFCNGDLRNIRLKSLGAGVYKIYSEPA